MNRPAVDEERFIQVWLLKLESLVVSDIHVWISRELTIMEMMRAIAAP